MVIAEHMAGASMKRKKKTIGLSRQGERNSRAKFTENDVKIIISRLLNGESSAVIARDYNRPPTAVSDIKNHRAWTYLTKDIVFV